MSLKASNVEVVSPVSTTEHQLLGLASEWVAGLVPCAEMGGRIATLLPTEIRVTLAQFCRRCVSLAQAGLVEIECGHELAQVLPWEAIALPELGSEPCPALWPKVGLVRRAVGARPIRPGRSLRVLIAYANPAVPGSPHLPYLDDEVVAVRQACLRANAECEVARLQDATPATLARELGRRPDIVHFIGHGRRQGPEGVIVLQGGRGEEAVGANEFAEWASGVGMVFLSACETAGGTTSFGDILSRSGVPFVIGVQGRVSDELMVRFAADFYRELLGGVPVAQAMARARTIHRTNTGWWQPVLFSAAADQPLLTVPIGSAEGSATPSNLPRSTRRFIGRDREIELIEHILNGGSGCVILISGLGGIGKTRLAIEVAERATPRLAEDTILVDCTTLTTLHDVYSSIASQLEASLSNDDPAKDLVKFLSARHLVLILDGCENLCLENSIEELEQIAKASDVHIVVTSRISFETKGHHVALTGLADSSMPESPGDSVLFFAECVARLDSEFQLPDSQLLTVKSICRSLDGIPLAIQLIAPRALHLSLDALLGSLGSMGTGEAFNEVLSCSLASLSPEDANFLVLLSTFQTQFDLADAARIVGTEQAVVSEAIVRLCDRSLLEPLRYRHDIHYRVLDTIRARVADSWSEDHRERHARCFLDKSRSLLEQERRQRADSAAACWRQISDYSDAWTFFTQRGLHAETIELARMLLPFALEAGLDAFSTYAHMATAACQESRDHGFLSRILGYQGAFAGRQGRREDCERLWIERAELCQKTGDVAGRADALIDLACRQFTAGNYELCDQLVQQALPVAMASNRRALMATVAVVRARVASVLGRQGQALSLAREAESFTQGDDDYDPLMFVFINLAKVYLAAGLHEDARDAYLRALQAAYSGDRRYHCHSALAGLADCLEKQCDLEQAAICLIGASKIAAFLPSSKDVGLREKLDSLRDRISGTAAALVFPELSFATWQDVCERVLAQNPTLS